MTEQNDKRIFLAGTSGAIGRLLAPMLHAHGWTVLGPAFGIQTGHATKTEC